MESAVKRGTPLLALLFGASYVGWLAIASAVHDGLFGTFGPLATTAASWKLLGDESVVVVLLVPALLVLTVSVVILLNPSHTVVRTAGTLTVGQLLAILWTDWIHLVNPVMWVLITIDLRIIYLCLLRGRPVAA